MACISTAHFTAAIITAVIITMVTTAAAVVRADRSRT
jgi:hypothetical protein